MQVYAVGANKVFSIDWLCMRMYAYKPMIFELGQQCMRNVGGYFLTQLENKLF